MRAVLEIAVDDPAGLAAALAGGANRIELCAALDLGGLTPSPGLIARAARAPVPVTAMIRPRPGDFRYDADELATMAEDIRAVRAAGLAGIVLGVTNADGWPDAPAINALRAAAGGLPMILHRAFDLAADPVAALDRAIDLGFARVMTSGGAARAVEGAGMLERLIGHAQGRIEVMAGGQITPDCVAPLARAGITAFHAACRVTEPEAQAFGPLRLAASRPRTSAAEVAALRRAIDAR